MANRAQRRAQKKATPSYLRYSKQELEKKLLRNGITEKDLEVAYNKGREEGFKASAEPVLRSCYAAVCLALHDLYGYGQKRCVDVVNKMDEHITYSLNSMELVEEVFDKLNITLAFRGSIGGDVATPKEDK